MRILIADDNPRVRGAIRDLLSIRETWDVCGETWNGPETLKQVRELRPDLVILDVHMPFPNGFETARLIRHELPQIKILIISQYDAVDLLPSALEAGADGYLDKARLGSDLTQAVTVLQDRNPPSAAPE